MVSEYIKNAFHRRLLVVLTVLLQQVWRLRSFTSLDRGGEERGEHIRLAFQPQPVSLQKVKLDSYWTYTKHIGLTLNSSKMLDSAGRQTNIRFLTKLATGCGSIEADFRRTDSKRQTLPAAHGGGVPATELKFGVGVGPLLSETSSIILDIQILYCNVWGLTGMWRTP